MWGAAMGVLQMKTKHTVMASDDNLENSNIQKYLHSTNTNTLIFAVSALIEQRAKDNRLFRAPKFADHVGLLYYKLKCLSLILH